MSREIWKPIPTAIGWFASSLGRVRMERTIQMPNGGTKTLVVKPTFGFFDKAAQRHRQSVYGKSRLVAALVCEAFHGPRPSPKIHCMHLDEDSKNNMAANLAWGTAVENCNADKFVRGKKIYMLKVWKQRQSEGNLPAVCKLTDEQVIAIRNMRARNCDIADAFGISRSNVGLIRKRKTWRHLP